jgi:hypothetical protein
MALEDILRTLQGVSPVLAGAIQSKKERERKRKLSIEKFDREQKQLTAKRRFEFLAKNYENFEPAQQRTILEELGIQPGRPSVREGIEAGEVTLSPEETGILREEKGRERLLQILGKEGISGAGATLAGKGLIPEPALKGLGLQLPPGTKAEKKLKAAELEKIEAITKATGLLGKQREAETRVKEANIELTKAKTATEKQKGLTEGKKTNKEKIVRFNDHIKNLSTELRALRNEFGTIDPEFENRAKEIRKELTATNKLVGILRGAKKPQSLDEITLWRRQGLIDAKFEKELKADLEGRVTTKAGKKFLALSRFPQVQSRANIIRQSFKKGNVNRERALRNFAGLFKKLITQNGITQPQLEKVIAEFERSL